MDSTSTTGLKGMVTNKMFGKKKKMPAMAKKPMVAPSVANAEMPTAAPKGIAVGNPKMVK